MGDWIHTECYTHMVWTQTSYKQPLVLAGLFLNFIVQTTSGLPISHPPQPVESQPALENLDLRVVDYHLPEGDEPMLGNDLVFEFKSDNLSGIVRLSRVDEIASNAKDVRYKHSKKQRKKDKKKHYDQKGAMYFAVSVVSLYGLSIGVLVAFSLRKDWDEDEVKNFQRSWVKMDHQMEKQEKQRAKRLMAKAIIAIHQPRKNSVAAVTSQAVYMALAPVALNGSSNQGYERRSSRETTIWNDLPPPMGSIHKGVGAGAKLTPGTISPAASSTSQCHKTMLSGLEIPLDEGSLKAPLASTSGDCRDWDLDHFETVLDPEEGKEVCSKRGHLQTQLEQMDRMLEEGQLEGDFSVDLPDGDFGLEDVPCQGYKRETANWDGGYCLEQSDRSVGESMIEEIDGMVMISPDVGPVNEVNTHQEPMKAFLGVLSPSLPFMDDELSPNWPESQVWELSPSEHQKHQL